ncbi:hypothetical protein PBI_SMARTIES_40 [Microbacterium phage Smarties]|uniref:Uncharacterized protein n=1 Tax=Microbacterium phage Ariadne TaxID=2656546 RepID=A0A649VB62_9CAUD|nr:hypothetical protein QDA10_gp040 [Microbacterium phage Ariadne]QGJ89444.1 hypothetical protein PBI_ARIADNE_40 [Microbacterium phage Ariadne]QGJ91431.1 hypothetical protein PBI_SMARTIES_40 [Microbacterium phage Smarties]
MPAPDLKVYLHHYRDLIEATLDPVPGKVFVQPGSEVAWDQEKCEGQAWSRVVGMTPVLGTRKANGVACVEWWDVTFAVGVLRCVANLTNRGKVPTAAQITADGDQFADDLVALLTAIECDQYVRQLVAANPAGPQGNAAGSEVQFIVRVQPCCD